MKEINCEQISILLTYFINNKLSDKIMSEIEYHLNTCTTCRERYMNLLRINQNYKEIQQKICTEAEEDESLLKAYSENEYRTFRNNLSAYIDNELNDKENIRIKKFAIINPAARQELENLISFRQLLQDSFIKTKSKLKKDLSEQTIKFLKENNPCLIKKEALNTNIKIFIITCLVCIICALVLF